jgi:2-oxoglutarate ferredoxin oxidoreductase subunit beta
MFGRHIGLRDSVEMFSELKKRVVYRHRPSLEEAMMDWEKGIVIGEFVERNNPSFIELLRGVKK